ncbi:sugar phosphate isomerase/epimerase [Micromonospora yasonensis]|uniref:sugar phosphate isomerase/epimerase family protein n=1 Tax=Micromonospora yasonensis TaxID=1128667 RepID=UPI0022317B47|nr:sugar phosphate isomerase/epimerase family protein [Micromonospora yasonensis]MCW3844885.1 sugar phosphate isomerase/epimerase [Micromonospora yasonensis]
MRRRQLLLSAIAATASLPAIAGHASAVWADSNSTTPLPKARPYYTGDFPVSLNLYSFNVNINAWLKGRKGAPPITTLDAIRFAKDAGFEAVDVTSYFIPGYDNNTMPTLPREEVMQYARQVRSLCQELGLAISGTGAQNDFAEPDDALRALDVERLKFWIDVAAEMGAPVMRVFSGVVPADIDQLGWEAIARDRVAPPLRLLADYAAARGVQLGLQNHGDMTATAEQTIQILRWIGRPNVGIIDDTGYFRPFQSATGLGYDWYADIAAVLPYTNNFQVKKKPAGAETDVLMDLDRLFTDVRFSSYRGYLPLEVLWHKDEPTNPKQLSAPPYDQITDFLTRVRGALARTKAQPFDAIDQSLGRFQATGDLGQSAYVHLRNAVRQAEHKFTIGKPDQSADEMRGFLSTISLESAAGRISGPAQDALSQQMNALLLSFTDVFGAASTG